MNAPKPQVDDFSAERNSERYATYSDLKIQYEGRDLEIPVRVPDISRDGMFINTSRTFPEGTVLKLQFKLCKSGREVRARAEVRYCLPGVGLGVQFVDMDPADQNAIDADMKGQG